MTHLATNRGAASVSHDRGSSKLGWIAFALTAAVLVVPALISLDTSSRVLVDTDGYMRSVRAAELLSGESGWFDGAADRANAPFGHSMHWTRPMDVILIGAGTPWLMTGADAPTVVYWGSVVVGPLLLLLIGASVAWAASPLIGRTWAPVAGAIAIAQPALSAYTAPGRSDHHALILLTGAVAAAGVVRMLAEPDRTVWPLVAGLSMGLGLWVSVESLFVLGVAGIAVGLAWVAGSVESRRVTAMWATVTAATAMGLALERADDVAGIDYDRVSLVHLGVIVTITIAWWAASALGDRRESVGSRLFIAAVVAVAGVAVVLALFPGLAAGPFAAVPETLRERWLDRVVELQPLADRSLGTVLALAAMPVIGLVAASAASRSVGRERGWAWVFVAIWTAAGLGLALVQTRWIMYAQLLVGIPVVLLAERGVAWFRSRSRPVGLLGAVTVVLLALFGWRVFVGLGSEDSPAGDRQTCSVEELSPLLEPDDVVLAAIDWGPEILWRTEASVVASPYHRNVDGILDTLDAFEGDGATAQAIVDERGVDTIAVCPGVDGKDYAAGPGSLLTRLIDGNPPSRLEALPGAHGGFLVFRVVD